MALAGEHVDDAIAELTAESKRDPLDGNVYDRLGDALQRKGDYTGAQQTLQRALLLTPNSTGPYILLGKVMLRQNDPATLRTTIITNMTQDWRLYSLSSRLTLFRSIQNGYKTASPGS